MPLIDKDHCIRYVRKRGRYLQLIILGNYDFAVQAIPPMLGIACVFLFPSQAKCGKTYRALHTG